MTETSSRSPGFSFEGTVGAALDTREGRSFIRSRLALLGETIGLLGSVFFVVLFILFIALGTPPRAYLFDRRNVAHLAGVAVMGLLCLVARRRASSLRRLGMLDGASLIACCTFWALMVGERPDSSSTPLLAASLTVLARAVIVPSTARRTLFLSVAAMAPTLVLALVLGPRGVTMVIVGTSIVLWTVAAVAIATLASRVIFGLRRRIKAAADVGAYILEEKIGAGGMGEVWRARHRLLIRPAAVKLIRPQVLAASSADAAVLMRRFEREARATANLKCPHTVELYDFGVAEDGSLYYVMELLEGFNLQELVQRFGPLPADRVVYLLHQVCCSLGEAHRNGLIHRDIKPANIFVTRITATADLVKVVDFGLVKIERPPNGADFADGGIATGTPAFMAPETVLRDGGSDHRADLYSFGCVAYWLLTGKLVFEGSAIAVLTEHAGMPPPPPSTRCELPIPPALEQLVLDCLEKDPARRPQSAGEIARRLHALPLPSHWSQERAEHWWDTHAREVGERGSVADLLVSAESRPRRSLTGVAPPGG